MRQLFTLDILRAYFTRLHRPRFPFTRHNTAQHHTNHYNLVKTGEVGIT